MFSMNLKNRFRLVFICIVLLLCSIAVIMSIGIRHTKAHIREAIEVDNMVQNLYELRILNSEYVDTPSDRVKQQWRTKYDQIEVRLLEQSSIPDDVSDALSGLDKLFTDLSTDTDAQGADTSRKVMRKQVAMNLNLESQRIIDWAADISRQMKDDIVPQLMRTITATFAVMLVVTFVSMTIIFITARHILLSINRLKEGADEIAGGRVGFQVAHAGNDEIALLATSINRMSHNLLESQSTMEERISSAIGDLRLRDRIKSGQNELNSVLRGDKSIAELADGVLDFLIGYIGAGIGVFYRYDEKDEFLEIISTYAVSGGKRLHDRIPPGEDLAGQVALKQKTILMKSVPHSYLPIGSALGEADPLNIIVLPLMNNDHLTGVLEIGSFKTFSDNDLEFLNQSSEGIAIALSVICSRQALNKNME